MSLARHFQLLPIMAVAITAIAVAALAAVIAPAPQHASALTNCTVAQNEIDRDAEENALLPLINAFRANPSDYGYPGLPAAPPLSHHPGLDRPSAWHVHDMEAKQYFAHNEPPPSNRSFGVRIANCDHTGYTTAAENIAAGNTMDAQDAFDAWLKSPGHRENMASAAYTSIGIARYFGDCPNVAPFNGNGTCWYWNTTFSNATPPSGAPTPTITSFNPAYIVPGSNGIVTITGTNFQAGMKVFVNGTEYTVDVQNSTTAVLQLLPAHKSSAMTLNIQAQNTGGSLSAAKQLQVRYSYSDLDCNGIVDAPDALIAAQLLVGYQAASCQNPADPDHSGGALNVADLLYIRQVVAGLVAAP